MKRHNGPAIVQTHPPFFVFSTYARWLYTHPCAQHSASRRAGRSVRIFSDGSAHRVISDLSAFIGHTNPTAHRMLVAGDLNTIYDAEDNNRLEIPARARTIFDRMRALGLEFVGPQWPNADRRADLVPQGLPKDTKNVPTYLSARQRRARTVVVRPKVAAEQGLDSEQAERVRGDARAVELFRAHFRVGDVQRRLAVRRDVPEASGRIAPVPIVEVRDCLLAAGLIAHRQRHDALPVGDRQAPEQHAVVGGERGAGDAEPQPEREHGPRRGPAVLLQQAHGGPR